MSLPRGGFGGGERQGRRGIAAAAALLIIAIGWGYLVVSWGDGNERATAAESTRGAEQTYPPESIREEPRVPGESAYATTPEEQRGSSTAGEERPAEVTAGATSPQPRKYGEEATDGPDASAGNLAEVEGERIRFAAAEFVSAAYGYSGDDPNEYNQGVGRTVVWPAFYSSAGGAEIARYAEQVESTGTEGAAKLTSFEVETATPEHTTGYAYFETGEGHDPRTGELTGRTVTYRQEMNLSRVGERWKVEATREVEEV